MLSIIRRVPLTLILFGVVACSRPSAEPPKPVSSALPPRQTADQPAFVDSVDARPVAASVVLCKTTADTLRRLLGTPTRNGILHGARVMSWSTRSQSPQVFLAVLVNGRGIVTDIYFDVPSELPWVPADQCAGR